jgi:hypothetical protein
MLEVEAQEKLRELGDTPYDVFRSLKAKGCKGEQSSNNSCPVAQFLKSVFPEAPRVAVLYHYASILMEAVDPPVTGKWRKGPAPEQWAQYHHQIKEATATLILPEAVAEFVRLFDNGKYPSLVAS